MKRHENANRLCIRPVGTSPHCPDALPVRDVALSGVMLLLARGASVDGFVRMVMWGEDHCFWVGFPFSSGSSDGVRSEVELRSLG